MGNNERIGFDQSGTRSWTIKATAGNLEVFSGDGNGSFKCGSTGGIRDGKGNLRSIPVNAKTGSYTLLAADAGKCVTNTTGGWTINNNVFSAGDAVTLLNNSGSDQTITAGSGVTLYNSADGSTGNRTLATRGMATIWFPNASEPYISGAGLS